MDYFRKKTRMIEPASALPGRAQKLPVAARHTVLGNALLPPYPAHLELALVGLGCFWGAERKFWQARGVFSTSVGYAGGYTPMGLPSSNFDAPAGTADGSAFAPNTIRLGSKINESPVAFPKGNVNKNEEPPF